MNDFIAKYKNNQAGVAKKQQKKEGNKSVTKALHETFKMAMQGQVAGIQHNGIQYLMMKQEVFNGIVQSGGKMLLTDEQKAFHVEYQVLMHLMNRLNIEVLEEQILRDELDQFTFDFSQIMNLPDKAKQRREVIAEFHKTIKSNELLITLETNIRNEMNPPKEEAENNGKLT